jgi:hypothetical protein
MKDVGDALEMLRQIELAQVAFDELALLSRPRRFARLRSFKGRG